MTTMMEKAARAVCEVTELFGREKEVIRAALQAIREPDQAALDAGMAAEAPGQGTMEEILRYDNRGDDSLSASFTAIIDAILEEKA